MKKKHNSIHTHIHESKKVGTEGKKREKEKDMKLKRKRK